MLDSELLLWLLVALQGSVKRYFPLLCLTCAADTCTACRYTLSYTQCKEQPRCHTCSITLRLSCWHTQHLPAHKHFFLTRQWRSELTSYFCVERNDCWGAEGERKLSVSVTSKAVELRKLVAFKNSNGDILHFCKLARHSEIVPLINSLKLWVMKSTGSFGRTQTLPPLKLSNLCTY